MKEYFGAKKDNLISKYIRVPGVCKLKELIFVEENWAYCRHIREQYNESWDNMDNRDLLFNRTFPQISLLLLN